MTTRKPALGLFAAWLALGVAAGCSGADFDSSGRSGAAGTPALGGTSGSAGTSGRSGGRSGRGGRGGSGQSGGSGGTDVGSGGSGDTSSGGSGDTSSGGSTQGGKGGSAGQGGSGGSSGSANAGGSGGNLGGTGNGGTSGTGGSPCVTQVCPSEAPADGDACVGCEVPQGGCDWDSCAVDGPKLSGQCVDDHWSITSESCGGTTCCSEDGDCKSTHCVNGVCKEDDSRGCWNDNQCSGDQICSGVVVCSCNARCSGPDVPGTCVPKSANCCRDAGDCKDGAECVKGVCKTPPGSGGCWTDRDCPTGGSCSGAMVCACGAACLVADTPGLCAVPL